MGSPPRQLQTEVEALRGAELAKTWTLPTAFQRMALRDLYCYKPNPQLYLRELRKLPDFPRESAPVFCLQPGVDKRPRPLEGEDEGVTLVRHAVPRVKDLPATTAGELRFKEAVYLARRRAAYADLRDDI